MKLTVMIQWRWWSVVTKYSRSERKTNTPGWRRFTTSLPRWENTKIRKMKMSRGADLAWFVQKGPGNVEERWRSVLYKLSIHTLWWGEEHVSTGRENPVYWRKCVTWSVQTWRCTRWFTCLSYTTFSASSSTSSWSGPSTRTVRMTFVWNDTTTMMRPSTRGKTPRELDRRRARDSK